MNEIELQLPTLQHKTAAESFKSEFFEIQEYVINGSALLDQMEYEQWLARNVNNRNKNTIEKDWVVATTFFAVRMRDNKIIGIIDIRHSLGNEFLTQFGGHIGYSVCPSERAKGFATEILKMGLEYLKSLSIEKVMIGCYAENIPSIRVIEKCGGILFETKPFTFGNLVNAPEENGKIVNTYWINL